MGDNETDKRVQAGVNDVSASDERICSVCQLCIVRPHRARLYKSCWDCASEKYFLVVKLHAISVIIFYIWHKNCIFNRKHDKAASKKDITATRKKKIWQDITKYRVGWHG